MKRLESFYGIEHVFGIAATYEEWRFFWFPKSDEYARDTIPKSEEQCPVEVDEAAEDSDSNEDDDGYTDDENNQPTVLEIHKSTVLRVLSTSHTIKYDDPKVMVYLVSVIQKMVWSPFNPVLELSNIRSYITLDDMSWYWSTVTWKTTTLNRHRTPNANTRQFVLLRDLRGGADGRVWMACTTSGLVCVLKFGRFENTSFFTTSQHESAIAHAAENLEREASYYKRLGVKVHSTTLCKQPVLILPHFTVADLTDESTQKSAKAAIDDLVAKGIYHLDMKKEHVFVETPKKKGQPKIIRFVDFAQARDINSGEDVKIIAEEMKKKLFI
eukprot:Phypoly_transcript_03728.p1 GENE.Phypoly_transcript_03728~~Phypoly_transcript_03728.p1  ORF type:complete len:327 (-),score=33.20 Phypoly_transcript_03728:58-1038(-)